ncbi:MAG: HlyD family secretion protein [Limisphaerales bacterium]
MDPLEPIPTTPRLLLREFAERRVPLLVFLCALGGAVYLWRIVGPGGIPGIAEAEQAAITAPQASLLVRVLVPPYQPVTRGQPIATLEPQDPRSSFDLLQAELALARLQLQPTLAEENALNFERVRVELLRTKSELAVAQVNLSRAEQVVARYEPLWRDQLVSEDVFDLALKSRDAHRAEVEAKQSAVSTIEERLTELQGLGIPRTSPTPADKPSAVLLRLEELKRQAQEQISPITLVSPISGLVHSVFRQAGENVVAGEQLFSISPLRSTRIVGYLRQPYAVHIEVGMPVEIHTRERPRRVLESRITRIGARVEPITNTLAIISPTALMDAGLPFVVDLPDHFDIRPGEIVDLRLRRALGTPGSVEVAQAASPPAAVADSTRNTPRP